MVIGRNHPCPCGSGKKYKKCHGALDSSPAAAPEAAPADTLKAADVKLSDRLMRFARMRFGPHWLQDVFDSEGLVASKLSDSEMPVVIPWLQHFRVNAAGVTLAEEWSSLERHVSPNEHVLLEAYDHAWLSLWEVADVERGVGSRLTDVLTHEERFVHDVSSSNTLRRFDTLLAIVLSCDNVSFFGGAHSQPLPCTEAVLP